MFLVHMNAHSDRVASYSKEKTAEMSFVTKHVTSVKSKSLCMHRKTRAKVKGIVLKEMHHFQL